MRHKGKYSMKEEKKPLGILSVLIVVLIVGLAAGAVMLLWDGNKEPNEIPHGTTETVPPTQTTTQSTAPTQEPVQTEPTTGLVVEGVITIETRYCPLDFPGTYSQYLRHTEVEQDGVVTEIFHMVTDAVDVELFRLCFSTEPSENDIGMLKLDSGNVYVSVSTTSLTGDEFSDEETINLYHGFMSSVDMVLTSVRNHSQFSKKGEVEVNIVDTKLDFWNISLPENMSWEEERQDGTYLVTFYGKLNGEQVKLYRAFIGEPQLKSPLGFYKLNGEMKPVSVESCELPATEAWDEETVTELYMMMSSINDLIQAILSDPEFSKDLPAD